MENETVYQDVIVVGGGPTGLMAAGQAAINGAKTLLLEKMEQPGEKLNITGKGRCNLTNIAAQEEFIAHFGREGQFLRQAFARFFSQDLLDFFADIGLKTHIERGGRIFPDSEDAQEVTNKLVQWAAAQGVKIQTESKVKALLADGEHIQGILTQTNKRLMAKAVILATGGASFTHTGSSGDGYRMAADLGHSIIPIRPALVPLKAKGDICQRLQGLTLRNVRATVYIGGKHSFSDFGEMLFTHFGISGPIILSMSGKIVDALRAKQQVEISIDLKAALDEKRLDARLLRDIDAHGKQHYRNLLKNLLPQKMIAVMADLSDIPEDKVCHQITSIERANLLHLLKNFRLEISGHLALDAAMVTAGGVALKEVDPRTMESRLVKGLYFAGEVLDLAADTGGFNLQAAFSTGWIAGTTAAQAMNTN